MEMECPTEFSHTHMDRRPRKRARLGWDIVPQNPKIEFTAKWVKGEALFQTHENLEHLAMMERVLGPHPRHMLKRADRNVEKYLRRGRLNWPEGAASRESMKAVQKLPRLQNLVMQHVDHSAGDLIDLLQGLLKYDSANRLEAHEALKTPLLHKDAQETLEDESSLVVHRVIKKKAVD